MARPKGSPKVGGRVAGTPNKATASMKAAIQTVYDRLQDEAATGETGAHAHFFGWAKDNETEFYKLAAKLIPVQLDANVSGHIEMIAKEQRDAAVNAALRADT